MKKYNPFLFPRPLKSQMLRDTAFSKENRISPAISWVWVSGLLQRPESWGGSLTRLLTHTTGMMHRSTSGLTDSLSASSLQL